VLPSQLAGDPQLRERFDREARAISSLSHPNICTLYDVGHEAGTDFLVLEYLEGQTLAERLAPGSGASASVGEGPRPEVRRSMGAGRLSVSEALAIAIQIADALDKAHRSGIVHRDLKPANVMLTKSGAKLLDFGLAKASTPVVAAQGLSMLPTTPPALTAQGAILGTFQYMAPEQIEGLDADARTDIFAFGALLFEILTGRRAFEGQTRAQLLGSILKRSIALSARASPRRRRTGGRRHAISCASSDGWPRLGRKRRLEVQIEPDPTTQEPTQARWRGQSPAFSRQR
jgi:serine/threonine protein kinase